MCALVSIVIVSLVYKNYIFEGAYQSEVKGMYAFFITAFSVWKILEIECLKFKVLRSKILTMKTDISTLKNTSRKLKIRIDENTKMLSILTIAISEKIGMQ